MKRLLLALTLTAGIAGCATDGAIVVGAEGSVVEPAMPGYVYAYPGGACWADDMYYGACPWYVGVEFGYFRLYGGGWYHERGYTWSDYHRPPPREWRFAPHGPLTRPAPYAPRWQAPSPHMNAPSRGGGMGRGYVPPPWHGTPRGNAPPSRGWGGGRGHR